MGNANEKGLKKRHLTAEQLFQIYQECSVPGISIKAVLQQHGLKPWDMADIRKRVRAGALSELSNQSRRGAPRKMVPLEDLRRIEKELVETKDALATVGHELSLVKKRLI